jgi:hypothetical protein
MGVLVVARVRGDGPGAICVPDARTIGESSLVCLFVSLFVVFDF